MSPVSLLGGSEGETEGDSDVGVVFAGSADTPEEEEEEEEACKCLSLHCSRLHGGGPKLAIVVASNWGERRQ
jgi:hypothetical protein